MTIQLTFQKDSDSVKEFENLRISTASLHLGPVKIQKFWTHTATQTAAH